MEIPPTTDEVRANAEVLVWFQYIGHISIKSGKGGHRIAIIGDVGGYQIILLEHYIKTHEITGKLLNSLYHFIASKSASFMSDFRCEQMQMILSDTREFVQINSFYEWKDASINFNGMFPLIIESGKGSCKFDIQEILKNSKTVAKKSVESFQQELFERKELLAKLKSKMLKKIELLGKQTEEAVQNKSIYLKEEGKKLINADEIQKQIERLNMKIKEVEEEESLTEQQQDEITTMIDAEEDLTKNTIKEESNLIKIERDLFKKKEELRKMKEQNRNRINQLSDKMETKYEKIEHLKDELEQSEKIELTKEVTGNRTENKNIDENITLAKFDARELGKLRVKFCGNEGSKKTHLQVSLEKQLTDLSDFYKKNEKAKFWQNSTIEIFNGNDYYLVRIGKGKKNIMITSVRGETKIELL